MYVEVNEVQLGRRYRDRISGFMGIAIGNGTYLYGCAQILLKPEGCKDGKPLEGQWFDIQRMETVDDGVPDFRGDPAESTARRGSGGPMQDQAPTR